LKKQADSAAYGAGLILFGYAAYRGKYAFYPFTD